MYRRLTVISILCLSIVGCASIPHYRERYTESREVTFPNVAPDAVWAASIGAIIKLEYVITSSDRNGGVIVASRGQGALINLDSDNPHVMNVVITSTSGGVSVTRQTRIQRVSSSPGEEIERFFTVLKSNLNELK